MKLENVILEDHNNIVKAFENESDRGAAVLAGSLIEHYLGIFLKSKMVDDQDIDELFDNDGPFSTFYQRRESAYAFGFISNEQRKILRFIQKIRNHFAHNPHIASFDKPPVSDWCQHISIKDLLPDKGKLNNKPDWNNRTNYMIAISLLVADWEIQMTDKK